MFPNAKTYFSLSSWQLSLQQYPIQVPNLPQPCIQGTLRDSPALPSAQETWQSPQYIQQRALDKKRISKELFAEYLLSNNRQRLWQVLKRHLAKKSTRENKNPKRPQNNSKKKITGRRPHWQEPNISVKVTSHIIFCAELRITRPLRFELMTSPSNSLYL
jgi:hypothetical protein